MIPLDRFNNEQWITGRLNQTPVDFRKSLAAILKYLYIDGGPTNLPRTAFKKAEHLLDSAEKVVTRWKITRTNGSERKNYGPAAGVEARDARYRCRTCGMPDTRVLDLDHTHGRKANANKKFTCLCVLCHRIKSRENDWSLPPNAPKK